MLSDILKDVQRGKYVERPWRLFHLTEFPGYSESEAERAVRRWAAKQGIKPIWEVRKVEAGGVITPTKFVRFERISA